MYELKVPKVLKKGDTIALISLSGGRAGDADMRHRYETGKKRLEEIWGVHVITTPHALAGSEFLYEHPEARGEDLMWAMRTTYKGTGWEQSGSCSARQSHYNEPETPKSAPAMNSTAEALFAFFV